MNNPDFTHAKVGDRAWSPEYGYVEIHARKKEQSVFYDDDICIEINIEEYGCRFDPDIVRYNSSGFRSTGACNAPKHPSLFNTCEQFKEYWEIR